MKTACTTITFLLFILGSQSLGAQAIASHLARIDWQPNVWFTAALGEAEVNRERGKVALAGSAWVSSGIAVTGVRAALAVPYDYGSGEMRERAALVGLRTPFRRVVLVGAIGYSSIREHRGCFNSCLNLTNWARSGAMAYSFQAIVNYKVIGVGMERFGTSGPDRFEYSVTAIAVHLGWFGH